MNDSNFFEGSLLITGKQKTKKIKNAMNELNILPIINENDAYTIYISCEFRVRFIVIP